MKHQSESEGDREDREDSKDGAAKLIYNNICVAPDMIITAIYYN